MFRFVSRLSLRCDSFGLLDLLVLCFVCWFSVLSSVCPSVQIPCWDSDPLDMGHMGHMGLSISGVAGNSGEKAGKSPNKNKVNKTLIEKEIPKEIHLVGSPVI